MYSVLNHHYTILLIKEIHSYIRIAAMFFEFFFLLSFCVIQNISFKKISFM